MKPWLLRIVALFCLAGSALAQPTTYVWTNTSGGLWTAARNWSPNAVPGGGANVFITNAGTYTITSSVPELIGGLTIGGASGTQTLNTATFTMNGVTTVNSNGVLNFGNASDVENTLLVKAGGMLSLSNTFQIASNNYYSNVTNTVRMTNLGTVINAASITGYGDEYTNLGGVFIYNSGLWEEAGNNTLNFDGQQTNAFINAGTLNKISGTGQTTFAFNFVTTGNVNSGSGSFELLYWDMPSVVNGTLSLYLTDMQAPVTVASNATLNLGYQCYAESWLWVKPTATLNINNQFVLAFNNQEGDTNLAAITNQGTVNWSAEIDGYANYYNGGGGAIINNSGVWTATGNFPLTFSYSGTNLFLNSGTLQKTAGTGTNEIQFVFNNNGGTLSTTSGSFSMDQWTGTGTVYGSAVLTGGTISGTLAPGDLMDLSDTTVTNPLVISTNATINWRGGDLETSLLVMPGGLLNILNPVTLAYQNYENELTNLVTLTNRGTIVWSADMAGYGNFYGYGGGAIIDNAGTWVAASNNGVYFTNYPATSLFVNTGTLVKTNSIGLSEIDWDFSTTGTINAPSGVFALTEWSGASTLTGMLATASSTFFAPLTVESNSSLIFYGGNDLESSLLIQPTATVAISNALLMGYDNYEFSTTNLVTVTNNGTVIWDANITEDANFYGYGGGAIIYNAGVWNAPTNVNLGVDTSGIGITEFINVGLLEQTGGASACAINSGFSSTGTINSLTGAFINSWTGPSVLNGNMIWAGGEVSAPLMVASNAVLNNVGIALMDNPVTVAKGATFNISGPVYMGYTSNDNDGEAILICLTNFGTVNWDAPIQSFANFYGYGGGGFILNAGQWNNLTDNSISLNNGGTNVFVNSGNFLQTGGTSNTVIAWNVTNTGVISVQTNTLTLAGTNNLTGGTLAVGINSLTNYGVLALSGARAKLTGTLSANFNDGFNSALLSSFAVVTFPVFTGSFTSLDLPTNFVWQTSYNPTNVTITAVNRGTRVQPVVSWSNPADIVYGTPLTGTQLDATAMVNGVPVPGSFAYNPPVETVLNASNGQTLSVTFTPSDPTTYSNATGTATINVQKAPLTITADGQVKIYGQTETFGPGSTLFFTSGLVGSDTVGSVTLAVSGNAGSATAPISGPPYTLTPSAATGGTFSPNNYSITYEPGDLYILAPNPGSGGRRGMSFVSTNIPSGNGPAFILAADIQGNGHPGLIAANFGFRYLGTFGTGGGSGTTLSIFTNDGHGKLALSQSPTVGLEPDGVAAADLFGTGSLDLISANVGSNSLTILKNNGHGFFTVGNSYQVGTAPQFVTAADVNGDGRPDLISAGFGNNTLTVLTNNGKGGFALSTNIPVGNQPIGIAAVDVNGDGAIDLVCANSGDGTLTVLTNDGKGNFTFSSLLTVTGGGGWVVGADVNGDGAIDLVTAGSTLNVFTNNGSGMFALRSTVNSSGTGSLTMADMNGDGLVDMVCENNGNGIQGGATIFTNDGTGLFSYATSFNIGLPGNVNYPNTTAVADFDGDGNMDFAVDCFGSANQTVLIQTGVAARPSVTITSPAQSAELSPSKPLDLTATATSTGTNKAVSVIFYIDGYYCGMVTGGPFNLDFPPGTLSLGSHALQAAAVDANGDIGWSPITQVNVGLSGVSGPPPVVNITNPTNGTFLVTNQSLTVEATASASAQDVELLVDGQVYSVDFGSPYSFQIPAGGLAPGGHLLQAVATNSAGQTGVSAPVYITENAPGTALIDFDPLNTAAGDVGGSVLANYLAQFGVTIGTTTPGTVLEAVNTNSVAGSVQVQAPSAPNFFTQAGLNQPISFSLKFANPIQEFGFTRAGLTAAPLAAGAPGQVTHPAWTATIFDSNGVALGSVSEPLYNGVSPLLPQSFVLIGTNIASVRFDSDSQGVAAFSGVLLDDLFLNFNPVAQNLAVTLNVISPATNNIVAPATVTIGSSVLDLVSDVFSVSYYNGPSLLGTVFNGGPLTLTNLQPGNYNLQAQVIAMPGLAETAYSPVVPITVQLGPNSRLVNFDAPTLTTGKGPVTGSVLSNYLAQYGITASGVTGGTQLAVESQAVIAGGGLVQAASPPNLLTQIGPSGPAQFTLNFAVPLSQFGFTRPQLLAHPYVSHPAWQAVALDGAGNVLAQASEGEIDSSTNVGADRVFFAPVGGAGISRVQFSSQGTGLTTFGAMLVDDLILTTNTTPFPPAVALISPSNGVVLAAPPAVTLTAAVSSQAAIRRVRFLANGVTLAIVTSEPFTYEWLNPPPGNYELTALAVPVLGATTLSSQVGITIQPSANQFNIATQPANQTAGLGGSATFSVVTTGTNTVTYQWSHNKQPINGATASTLVVGPPLADADAGTYSVVATSGQVSIGSTNATLTVVDPPGVAPQPQGATNGPGSIIVLTTGGQGIGPFTFQWLLNGVLIPGQTNSSYTIPSAQPLNSGNYQCAVGNLATPSLSQVAPVVITTGINIPPTNNNFASSASFNPLAGPVSGNNQLATPQTGAPLPNNEPGGNSIWFKWKSTFTGTISLTTAGSDFDTIMAVYTGSALNKLKAIAADDDSGGYLTSLVTFNVVAGTNYYIAVDGYQGAAGRVVLGMPSGTAYRILNPSSGTSLPVIVKNPENTVAAPGSKVTLSVQATSPTKPSYQWYFQGTPIANATNASFVISPLRSSVVGFYFVLVQNAAGAAQSQLADVEMSTTQGVTSSSTEYKFVNNTSSQAPSDLATVIQPQAGGGDTRGFSVSQVFSTVGATAEQGEPEPCGQVGTGAQWFVYTAQSAGTLQASTEGSTFNTLLGVYTGSGTSFSNLLEVGCGYTTNYLTDGQPSVEIPQVAKGTKFYIMVAGYQGAVGVAQLKIGLGQTLSFSSVPASRTVAAGSNTTFSVTTAGSIPSLYQWQLNGANLPGANESSFTLVNPQAAAAGNYTVVVSNVVGLATSSPPAALTVQFSPVIVSGPSNETVKVGAAAKFVVTAYGGNEKTNKLLAQWYFNDAPLPDATALTLTLAKAAQSNAGPYFIVVSNSYGAITSAPATLTIVTSVTAQPGALAAREYLPSLKVTGSSLESAQKSAADSTTAMAGTYSGLFMPALDATTENSGFFSATLSAGRPGAFSAYVMIDGTAYPFAGQFDAGGNASATIERPGQTLGASLHFSASPPGITGAISNAQWLAPLQAGPVSTVPGTNVVGSFSLGLAPDFSPLVGTLTTSNGPGASILVEGTLPGGEQFMNFAPMLSGNLVPIYAPMDVSGHYFAGWLSLTNAPGQTNVGKAWQLTSPTRPGLPLLIGKDP